MKYTDDDRELFHTMLDNMLNDEENSAFLERATVEFEDGVPIIKTTRYYLAVNIDGDKRTI